MMGKKEEQGKRLVVVGRKKPKERRFRIWQILNPRKGKKGKSEQV